MDWLDYTIMAIKVFVLFGFVVVSVALAIWVERRLIAFMQQRVGPNRVGPFGILQSLADGVKLMFKEDIEPAAVDRGTYRWAPLASLVPALLTFAVIPVGADIRIGSRTISLQLADLNVGVLYFLAMGSLMVYGVVLAGWSSGSAYPLLGGVRSSAQMISYELGMGLAAISVVMYAGTLSTRGIVDAQSGSYFYFLPRWFVFAQLPAFVMFLIVALAETNRAPFDLPEAETELVGGFHTEYSGIRFAMFQLAEYLHVFATSAMIVTLFLGGWRGPIPPFWRPIWPVVWFGGKLGAMVFLFMWARATFPRVRYDRLMRIGWKIMVPAGLAWIAITAVMVVLPQEVATSTLVSVVGLSFGVLMLGWLTWATKRRLGTLDPLRLAKVVRRGPA